MFATYFEWQSLPGSEDDFKRFWSLGTEALRHEGSLGSALFESGGGRFHAFARWPDRETRDAAFAKRVRPEIFAQWRECIAATLVAQDMTLIDDQWVTGR